MDQSYLHNRLNELIEEERVAFVNLGKAIGARDEIERLIRIGEAENASPQPKGEDDAPTE